MRRVRSDERYLEVLESIAEWNECHELQTDYDFFCLYPKLKDLPDAYKDRIDELDDLVREVVGSLKKLSEFVQEGIEAEKDFDEKMTKLEERAAASLNKIFNNN